MNQTSPSPDTIARRAYELWEQAGRPDGRDQEFWLRAEAELTATRSAAGAPPIIAPPQAAPPASSGALPPHEVPPTIKSAVASEGRRPASRRAPKRG
ncbi:MAG: DUF2934 domain-containing protein [Verrucomicrobia bacterium]|nr:DUF2934 domain-containing protein [Verrucomicrobiota bacterium]